MYWTTAQQSFSGSACHDVMAPRPVLIFENN
jgi:hypothetical protein